MEASDGTAMTPNTRAAQTAAGRRSTGGRLRWLRLTEVDAAGGAGSGVAGASASQSRYW